MWVSWIFFKESEKNNFLWNVKLVDIQSTRLGKDIVRAIVGIRDYCVSLVILFKRDYVSQVIGQNLLSKQMTILSSGLLKADRV